MKLSKTLILPIACLILSACSAVPSKTLSSKTNNTQSSSNTDNSVWMDIGKTDSISFQIRKGSFNLEETEANIPVASILGQLTVLKTNQTSFVKYYVPIKDCLKGFGSVYILSTDNKFLEKESFVNGGDNVSSLHADIICAILEDTYQKAKNSIPDGQGT